MNIVDTSGCLEYFVGSSAAKNFEKVIENQESLLIPSICIYEVFKKLLANSNEDAALLAVSHMRDYQIVNIDFELSVQAAKISWENKIPMAESIILACGKKFNATIYTQDSDFEGLPNVKYFPKA